MFLQHKITPLPYLEELYEAEEYNVNSFIFWYQSNKNASL